MQNQDINEKLIKQQHESIKKSGNQFLIGFFLVFMIGYFFFFTSNLWLPPDYDDIQITPIGRETEKNNRSITLVRWDYCEDTRSQEIIIEISNKATDSVDYYEWSILDRHKGPFEIEEVVETKDLVVLHVKNMHRQWTELSLRMDAADAEGFETVKLYASKKSVDRVDKIEPLTENEYRRQICTKRISEYETEIDTRLVGIAAEEEVMKNAKKHIEELKKRQSYETKSEIAQTNEDITALYSEISNSEKIKEKLQEEIREYEDKIKMQKKKMKAL